MTTMHSDDLQDLPEEVRAEIERPQVERADRLNGLATHIAKLRDEAVAARKDDRQAQQPPEGSAT